LSRADIAKALSKSDQFDFLIDIVPREEASFPGPSGNANGSGPSKKVFEGRDLAGQTGITDPHGFSRIQPPEMQKHRPVPWIWKMGKVGCRMVARFLTRCVHQP